MQVCRQCEAPVFLKGRRASGSLCVECTRAQTRERENARRAVERASRPPIVATCRNCGCELVRTYRRKSYICAPCHGRRKRPGQWRPGRYDPTRYSRRKLDPTFVVAERRRRGLRRKVRGYYIAKTLRDALKRNGTTSLSTFLGYTPADLAAHLERRFTPGMSWAEFCAGRIEIDHIRPLAAFDVSNVDELRAAWALSNLQPLWARDNREKGARLPA